MAAGSGIGIGIGIGIEIRRDPGHGNPSPWKNVLRVKQPWLYLPHMAAARDTVAEQRGSAPHSMAGETPGTGIAIVIPSIGAPTLGQCLEAVEVLDPAPKHLLVVFSGELSVPALPPHARLLRSRPRLGFAAAVNLAFAELADEVDGIAVLNDDALPPPNWLGVLGQALDADSNLAAVQSTVTDRLGAKVDGRGIELDSYGLPIQVDRGHPAGKEPDKRRIELAVSGTAALFRTAALRQASIRPGVVLDPVFGSYHEDLDLGLRLRRLGWTAAWTPGAAVRHLGSASGATLEWRHPWWVLANRWRALAGNLGSAAILRTLPRLLRGEIRAVRTLWRKNLRTAPVAMAVLLSLPGLILAGRRRRTPGPRLKRLPSV
jgi:GT2 family glycosyltransferase